MSIFKTQYFEQAISEEVADALYFDLINNLQWSEGIRSKNGFTRKACILSREDYILIFAWII